MVFISQLMPSRQIHRPVLWESAETQDHPTPGGIAATASSTRTVLGCTAQQVEICGRCLMGACRRIQQPRWWMLVGTLSRALLKQSLRDLTCCGVLGQG